MKLDEAGSERHEGSDEGPGDLNLDGRDLDVVLSGSLEERDGEVKDVGREVVGDIEGSLWDDGDKGGKSKRATHHP